MKGHLRVHLYISGIVQGVFFRAHTRDVAESLSLTGWVRNLRDGKVEIVAEGAQGKIEQLIRWCRKGPPGSRVDNVEIYWEDATGAFKDFAIRYHY